MKAVKLFIVLTLLLVSCGPQEPAKIPVTGIALDRVTVTLTEGENTALVATITPADATDKTISWSSSNQAVATVTDGVINALKAGTAVITAKTNDGGITASCTVNVDTALAAITGDASQISCRNAVLAGKVNVPGKTATDLTFGVLYSTSSGVLLGKAIQVEATVFDADYNYTITTEALEPETIYYYRSYISQNGEITYGDTKTFTTLPISSLIKTEDVTDINPYDATLHASLNLIDCQYQTIEYGFKVTPDGGSEESYPVSTLTDNKYSLNVKSLTRQTKYSTYAYVKMDDRLYVGDNKEFTTSPIRAEVILNDAKDITEYRATISGSLKLESHGSFIKSARIYYSDRQDLTDVDMLISFGSWKALTLSGSAEEVFSYTLSSLIPGKEYHYAVVATIDGVSFTSVVKEFTTATIAVTLTALETTNITEFSATLNGKLSVNSIENTSKRVWFYYSETISDAAELKTNGTKLSASLTADGTFSYKLTGLSCNVVYYFLACAMVGDQDYYSEVKTFSTADFQVDIVAENATSITEFKGTLNGRLSVISIESLRKSVCFYYSANASDVISLKASGTKVPSTLTTNGTFSRELTGLTCNTTYYYIASATINDREFISDVMEFSTASYSAEVVLNDVTDITELKSKVSGKLNVYSIERLKKSVAVYYSPTENTAGSLKAYGTRISMLVSSNGEFTNRLTGLTPNTTYYYIAVATVNDEEFFSEVSHFTTANYEVAIEANGASDITEFKGTLNGRLMVTSIEELDLDKSVSFYYSSTATDVASLKSNGIRVDADLLPDGSFSCTLTGLTHNTQYYYIACASVHGQEYMSVVNSFSTAKYTVNVTAEAATDITEFKGTLNGRLAVSSIEELNKSVSFYYSSTATDAASLKTNGSRVDATLLPDGSFNYALTGLTHNTRYYYIACATVHGQEHMSAVNSFSTAKYTVNVTIEEATDITEFKGTLTGHLIVSSIEELDKSVSFYYSSTATDAASLMENGVKVDAVLLSDGSFSCALTGLTYNTKYYYIACAIVSGNAQTSAINSFTTANYIVNLTSGDASSVKCCSATLEGSLSVLSVETLNKTVWFVYSETVATVEALITSGTKASSMLSGDAFFANLSGLKDATTYYYTACAKVHDKEVYGPVKSFTTNQLPIGAINMGLSVPWHQCNLGATNPEKYGNYFSWGETSTKPTYDWTTYSSSNGSETSPMVGKYCTDSKYGIVDNVIILNLEDDAAHALLGEKWRMPTEVEWAELINPDNCTWIWTTQNEVSGHLVISKKTGNSIFFPAAGYYNGSSRRQAGKIGEYWSSTLDTGYPICAIYFIFNSSGIERRTYFRKAGMTIRPVSD